MPAEPVLEQIFEYRAALLEHLARQPSELAEAIAAIPEVEWSQRRSAEGYTVHQVVFHVRDLETLAFVPRFRRILTEDNPTLDPFPSHDWSAEKYQPAEPMTTLLTDFARAREEALQLMGGLTPDDWSRTGFHLPSGARTAQWWAERMYTHAQEHLEEIRRMMKT